MFNWIKNLFSSTKVATGELITEESTRSIEFYDGNMPCSKSPSGELELLCPECKTWVNRQKFNHNWDWAGPHCPNCDAGGMDYFAGISGPIESSRKEY